MASSIDELLALLDLEQLDVGLFRGSQPESSSWHRVFGGQVAAQAVMAAQRTVPADRAIHSLHVYFILGGDPSIPIIYDVEFVRDGRSFTTRRVAARQHGEIIFDMTASFHVEETGWDHHDPMPTVAGPEAGTPLIDIVAMHSPQVSHDEWNRKWGGFDMLYLGDTRVADDATRETTLVSERIWIRARGVLPDDPLIHRAAFTYISDFSLLGASVKPHGVVIDSPEVQPASLDHTIWFHRPFRADEWFLYDQASPSASGARGLSIAKVFEPSGRLVASAAQEGLIRQARPR